MTDKIRSIKPDIRDDETVGACSHAARWLFVVMITLADDHGNLRGSNAYLRSEAFKYDDDPPDLRPLLEELDTMIEVYEVGGERYIHLINWAKHQKIDQPSKPRYPLPPGWTLQEHTRTNGNRTRTVYQSYPAHNIPLFPARQPHTPAQQSTALNQESTALQRIATGPDCDQGIVDCGLWTVEGEVEGTGRIRPEPTPEVRTVIEAIDQHRDLWPGQDPTPTAERLAREFTDPKVKASGITAAFAVKDAAPKVREWLVGKPNASPAQALAHLETACSWIIRDIRLDKLVVGRGDSARAQASPGQTGGKLPVYEAAPGLSADEKRDQAAKLREAMQRIGKGGTAA